MRVQRLRFRALEGPSGAAIVASLLGLQLLALALRALSFPEVFPGDGSVALGILDSAYHARRALYSFVNFPAVLDWDPYMAFPDGAPVPLPPLFDWALAGVARLFGDDLATFDRVAAWASPVLGALSVIPVYAIGRALGGHGVGLGAGALFAALPVVVVASRIGDIDHHAAVTALGAAHLALCVALAKRDATPRRIAWASAGLLFTRAALALSWSGSLLYLALGDAGVLLIGLLLARREVLFGQALGAAGAALLLVPWLVVAAPPLGGPYSTTTLSWIHVLILGETALLAATLAALTRFWSGAGSGLRLGLAAGLALAALAGLLFLVPETREALRSALPFFARSDGWGHANLEQRPLFRFAARGFDPSLAHQRWGLLAYAIPFALLATLGRARSRPRRAQALCVASWMLVLGPLALLQERFGRDFAPSAAVGLALLFDELARPLRRRAPAVLVNTATVALAVALLWPGFASAHWPHLLRAITHVIGDEPESAPQRLSARASLIRFAREIRAATPDTAGYFDASVSPEYAILAEPSYGHVLHHFSRRATPANNLGPYLDLAKFRAVSRAYAETGEAAVIEIAQALGTRYVLTSFASARRGAGFLMRLHRGALGENERSEQLRLILEGPPGGALLGDLRRPPPGMPAYQLYEVVPGATLEVAAPEGTELRAEAWILTTLGRRFAYRGTAWAGADGVARLRVAYADRSDASTRAEGPYQVWIDARERSVSVSDRDVRGGETMEIPAASFGSPARAAGANGSARQAPIRSVE